jgi:hypothetical protein
VLALAEELLPLAAIASGPADELGLRPQFSAHHALDFVVQALRDLPGRGWRLVRAALASPVVRNRNMAIQALAAWGRERWPVDAEDVLREALGREPRADVRAAIEETLAGRVPG